MLTGLLEPTSGEASIAGASITDRDALRPHIGYLPEEPPLYEETTAYQQLEYIGGLRDIPTERIHNYADVLFDALDLEAGRSQRISEYSKGMRQKVAYVQTILHDPDVVFLDEPTSGLDPRAAKTLREMIRGLADDGTTVFLSTHILPVVEEVADTVGILYDGNLVEEGTPAELTDRTSQHSDSTLEDAFLELTDTDPVKEVLTHD
ncbi:ABC transporter ATP-binding protein [Halobacterium noricense]